MCLKQTRQLLGQIQAHKRWEKATWGLFLMLGGGLRRWRNSFLQCQMRQRGGTGKEQIKEDGKSGRLRPRAEQIRDSAAAGSSLRQDNRANRGRKEIRPVNSAAHPWTCADTGEQECVLQRHGSASPSAEATPPHREVLDPSRTHQMTPANTMLWQGLTKLSLV